MDSLQKRGGNLFIWSLIFLNLLFRKKQPVAAKITRCTDQFRRRKIVYIHAADVALPGFTFNGIEVYFDRSLVCDGGVMVVAKGAFGGAASGYIDYLVSLGIGPDMVIEVDVPKGKNLYQSILASREAREKIMELVYKQGFKIEFFNTRNGLEDKFVSDLGMTWERIASFPGPVADMWNNKALIRRLARTLHVEHLFPWHIIVRVPPTLRVLVALFVITFMKVVMGGDQRFVVKLTNWASGLGQLYTRSRWAIVKFFFRNWLQTREIVFEEDLGPHDSITYVRRFKDGKIEDEWPTVQLIARTPDGVEDLGRVLSTRFPPGLTNDDVRFMKGAHKVLDKAILAQVANATGVICLDFARRKGQPTTAERRSGLIKREGISHRNGPFQRMFVWLMKWVLRRRGYTLLGSNTESRVVLEANVRVTFSDYVRQLMNQVKRLLGVKHLVCIQFKVRPTTVRSFEALQTELGELAFSIERRQGVIPMVPRCLPSGYVYFVAFGATYEIARDLATASALKLGDIKLAELLHTAE